jgi:hypothetical protein
MAEPYGYIYLTENKVNGKKYVGQSTRFVGACVEAPLISLI